MYPMEIMNGVRLITETCFAIKGGERVIIVAYSDEDLRVAAVMAADMRTAGADVATVITEPPKAIEPPPFLAEAMKKVDILISLGDVDYGHTMARKEASLLKYAYMPAIMSRAMTQLEFQPGDLFDIKERTERICEAVSRARVARVTSPAGTDIVFDITGRMGVPIHPVFEKPGHLAIIPFYAEVACAPVEATAEGTYVTNGSIWGHASMECIVSEPLYWTVNAGRVVDLRGGKEARLVRDALAAFDDNAWSIAELGIGTNHKLPAEITGTKLDDAILGHVHVALGRNMSLGGNQWSQIHVDFLSMGIKLELDGQTIIENGRCVI